MTTNPKENHRMTTEERPTKALVAELRAQLAALTAARHDALMDLRTSEDRRKVFDADPEARCLAECTAAIDALKAAYQAASRRSSYGTPGWVDPFDTTRPAALSNPVGRVLLHLAARYNQQVGAIPPPVPERPEGQQLVSVPAHVAEQLNRMPMEAWER